MSKRILAVIALVMASPASAKDAYKIEKLTEAPPTALAEGLKGAIGGQGLRIVDADGKPLADLWLRSRTPALAKPSGPKGAILYPVLSEGELLGAIKFVAEGHDYRDQTIAPGVYTLRYGLQPVNGDHLGVSVNRDYVLLLPASKDTALADLPPKKLNERSAEAVGTTHPGVLLLLSPPEKNADGPTMISDATLNTWGAVISIPLEVPGEANPVPLAVQLVLVGAKTD